MIKTIDAMNVSLNETLSNLLKSFVTLYKIFLI